MWKAKKDYQGQCIFFVEIIEILCYEIIKVLSSKTVFEALRLFSQTNTVQNSLNKSELLVLNNIELCCMGIDLLVVSEN